MASLAYPAPRNEDDETATGGPIAALVIAVPISLILWGMVFLLVVFIGEHINFVH